MPNTRHAAARNMDLSVVRMIFYLVLVRVARGAVSHHPCTESRDSFGELTVDCSSNQLTHVPVDVFPKEMTRLILIHSTIQVIPADAFRQLSNLRTLDLSMNRIRTLHNASFRGLTYLQMLNLNQNEITYFPASIFNEMYSLETLTISGRHQKYEILPTLPVNAVRNLRTLSLSLRNGALIPNVYGQIPTLETLDFFASIIGAIDRALLDGIRNSNISSLSFRNDELRNIAPGTFSNMPKLQSIMFCCNYKLGLKESIAAITHTYNSNIDTVVLDNVQGIGLSVLDEAEFCSPFWRKIRRLSVRDNNIIAYVATNASNGHCLEELREFDLSYNYLVVMFPRWSLLSLPKLCSINVSKHRGFICSDNTYYDVGLIFRNNPSCVHRADIDTNNRTSTTKLSTWEQLNKFKLVYVQPSIQIIRLEKHHLYTGQGERSSVVVNHDNNIIYINMSMCSTTAALTVSIIGLRKLRTLDVSHGTLVSLTPQFVDFPNLQNLNLTYNKLETASLEIICAGSPNLVDFDVSYNRLRAISPSTFSNNQFIAHIKLGGNALSEVELELKNLTRLETLSDSFVYR